MGSKIPVKWLKQLKPSQVQQLLQAEKDIEKARLIFDSATAEYGNGFRHDHSTFGLIISRHVSANQFRAAEELLNRMKEEKCNFTEDIFLSICRAYGRVHKPMDALRIFRKMKELQFEPTERSYITVFDILVDENQLKLAQRFFKYMRQMGIPLSVTSINVLIKALCKNSGTMDIALRVFHEMPNRGCVPDSYTYGTLISGLCKFRRIEEAKMLLKEMNTKACSPTVVTYTSLIHGLCQSNNLVEAMELFGEMRSKAIEPNVVTYSSLMDGLCKCGRSSEALELLDKMIEGHHFPNMITYSTLIHGLCKEQKIQEALEILDRMKLQGLKPDAGLYGKIICGLCDSSKFQEAANFLDEMILGGISINRLTWNIHVKIHNAVVQGLCAENNTNRAFLVYLSMQTRGISTDVKTYNSLVCIFSKKGDLLKAAHIIDEMVREGCFPDEVTWCAVVSAFWCRRKVREAAELVQVGLMDEIVQPRS